jgi:hypothetical protein
MANTKSGSKDTGSVAPVNTSSKVTRNEKSTDTTFAKGGNTKMFTPQAAEPMKSGTTGDPTGPDSAPGAKFAEGGKGKMFGFAGSASARDGITSAR